VGELASAIDLLAADDLPGLPAPALLDRLAGLLREHNRVAAEIARTARHMVPKVHREDVDHRRDDVWGQTSRPL
jgi:hypothetical protein